MRLAEDYGLAALVVPLPEQGLGFIQTDIPLRLRDILDPGPWGSELWRPLPVRSFGIRRSSVPKRVSSVRSR